MTIKVIIVKRMAGDFPNEVSKSTLLARVHHRLDLYAWTRVTAIVDELLEANIETDFVKLWHEL